MKSRINHTDDDREPRDSRMTKRDGYLFDPMARWSHEQRHEYERQRRFREETNRINREFGRAQMATEG